MGKSLDRVAWRLFVALAIMATSTETTVRSETIMINAGGSTYTDSAGERWLRDRRFLPLYKGVKKLSDNVESSKDEELFQSCRVFHRNKPRPFQYRIPLHRPGLYEVSLFFSEIDSRRNATAKRRFDVVVQGQPIANNFDIYQRAGEALYIPTVPQTTIDTTLSLNSSEIIIELIPRRFNPMICGIQIKPVLSWKLDTTAQSNFHPRHEACFVMASDEKAYLIGGRSRNIPVNVYDPETNSWSTAPPPSTVKRLHHMQCVPDQDGKIWIVSAWTGNCCREQSIPNVLVFDTKTLGWDETKTALPQDRRRGSAAAVRVGRSIYLAGGNRGGHGAHSNSVPWFDRYDMDDDKWETDLPDAPHARDHAGGGLLVNPSNNRTLLCVSGGRNGGVSDFFNATIGSTDCFDFEKNEWDTRAVLPVERAGAAYAISCDGTKLIIAGGEGHGRAYDNVDVFDGQTFSKLPALNVARHGTGLAMDCQRNKVYIASGSGAMGGDPELQSLETMQFNI